MEFKKVLGAALIIVSVLSLSACGLIPLPDDQRYSKVNEIKDQLDLESAGEIVSEEYSGDGVWSGSSYIVEIEGEDSFEKLSNQLRGLSSYKGKCAFGEAEVQCISSNPSITLKKNGERSNLVVRDAFGGHDEE